MADTQPTTQPLGAVKPIGTEYVPRTRRCNIGRSYNYLCQVGNTFTYSHVEFGKVVWHRHGRLAS